MEFRVARQHRMVLCAGDLNNRDKPGLLPLENETS